MSFRKIINFIRKKTSYFFFKNFAIFLIVFTLFAVLVIGITYTNIRDQELKAQQENYSRILERAASQINVSMKEMSHLSIYIATAYSSENLSNSYYRPKDRTNDFLVPYSVPVGNEAHRVIIMDENNNFHYFGIPVSASKIEENMSPIKLSDYFSKISDSNSQSIFLKPHEDLWGSNQNLYLLTCIREITNPAYPDSKLVWIEQSANILKSILKSTADEKLILVDKDGYSIPLSPDESSRYYPAFVNNRSAADTWSAKNLEGADCYYIAQNLNYNDWTLLLEVEEASLTQAAKSSMSSMLILLIFLYLCSIPIVFLSMRQASKPLIKLRKQIDKVNFDDYEIEAPSPFFNDEIELLNEALKRMLARINQAADEKAMMHSREIHASFLALQAQIKPHFLFNTLQIFIAMANNKQNEDLIKALHTFSNLLRYVTTSSPKVVTLKSEIENIDNYLELMRLCKGEQLEYTIDIENHFDLEQIYVPRMSLQPLVENAFKHGFSQIFPPWKLHIKINSNEHQWKIHFYNNGAGMNEKDINDLLKKIEYFLEQPVVFLENLQIGGMGLISCLSRFKNLYHENFSFKINTEDLADGFAILLIFEKENNYESTDH